MQWYKLLTLSYHLNCATGTSACGITNMLHYCSYTQESFNLSILLDFWLKFNPTITPCLIYIREEEFWLEFNPYIREEDPSITSKKSDDFWRQCAPLLVVPYLKLMRYTHQTVLNEMYNIQYTHCYQCMYLVNILSLCNLQYTYVYALAFL